MDYTIYLPTSPLVTFFVVAAPTMTMLMGAIMWLRSRTFRPGAQYNNTVSKLKETKKNKKDPTEKEINKQLRARVTEDNFNLTAKRCGMGITFEENNRRRAALVLPALAIGVMMFTIGIAVMNISNIITLVFIIAGIIIPMSLLFGNEIKIMRLKKSLHNDMIKDISRLVSMYKYSDTKKGIYGTIIDFMDNSTALRVDLEMFLADLNSFELNEALDRMGSRVPVVQMTNFISYVKSSSYMSSEQVVYSVMSLDNELKTQVKEIMEKEVKKKFKMSMMIIMVCFTAVLMIYTAPTLADIDMTGMF